MAWQKSSQKDIIPLPDLSFYHNFYLQAKVAKKVLSIQLGADVSYFSKYHAHFLCKCCGRVYDLPLSKDIKKVEALEIGGHYVQEEHYYYKGICKYCKRNDA